MLSAAFIFTSKFYPIPIQKIRLSIVNQSTAISELLIVPVDYAKNLIDNIDDLAKIREQNLILKEEIERLQTQRMKTLQIEVENEHLRKLLSFIKKSDLQYQTARVLGNTSGSLLRSAVINIGSNNNVKRGQAVLNDQGLVGRIIEVGEKSSRILLLTDINSKIPIITNQSRERGILVGTNSKNLHILYLPEDTRAKIGELILTSGDGEIYPSGQPIGEIESQKNGIITVKPYVDWARLEFVSVVDY